MIRQGLGDPCTWRRSLEAVPGLVLAGLLLGQGADGPPAQVLLQFLKACGRGQVHEAVQEVPVLRPRVALVVSQVPGSIREVFLELDTVQRANYAQWPLA